MVEPDEEPPPAGPKEKAPKPPRRSSGRGLAALMLIVGLLVGVLGGALLGVYGPGERGAVDGDTTPGEPDEIVRTVEVPVTPEGCLAALDDLLDMMDDLAEAREELMRADLARVAGDEEGAGSGLAGVDRRLRSLIIAANSRSLREAVSGCRGDAPTPEPEESTPEPAVGTTPEITDTPDQVLSPTATPTEFPSPSPGTPSPDELPPL